MSPDSLAEAVLAGGEDQDGAYLVLMKWYPGWLQRKNRCGVAVTV